MKTANTLLGVASALLLVACGSSAAVDPDAAVDRPDAADNPDDCLAEADYGAVVLGEPKGRAVAAPSNPNDPVYYEANGYVNDDLTPDRLIVGLFEGAGAFAAGPVVPGTYQIAGPELNFATCGVCIRVVPDVGDDGKPVDQDGYMATGGTVVLTQTTPRLIGSVSNITFEHVIIGNSFPFASSPHPDGCTTALTSASFDVELVPEVEGQN